MIRKIIGAGVLSLTLTGCGNNEDNEAVEPVNVDDVNTEQLDAELMLPEEAEPGDEIEIEVLVMQGEEKVDDAGEVVFEVWKEDEEEDSEMVEADLPGEDGVYSIDFTFEEDEAYFVQPHITARGMHVMPVEHTLVGDAEIPEDTDTEEWEDADMNDHEAGEDHEHGNNDSGSNHDEQLHEDMTVEWHTSSEVDAGDEVNLETEAVFEDEEWTDGDVQFEVWHEEDEGENHEWIEAEERSNGFYEAPHTFAEEGTHHVMIHLEDDDIHEHTEYELNVE